MTVPVERLWDGMKDSGLPPLWTPAKQNFFVVSELPILGTGKLDLKGVKKIAVERTSV